MSIEELQTDLKANMEEARALVLDPDTSPTTVSSHLLNTLWPFLENVVAELSEQDDVVTDLIERNGDMLQPETAGIFAAIILGARGLAQAEIKRAGSTTAEMATFVALLDEGEQQLSEITIDVDDEDEEEDEDPDAGSH